MKDNLITYMLLFALLPFFCSCKKDPAPVAVDISHQQEDEGFHEYIIRDGEHYADFNPFQQVEYEELKFQVKFDQTAEYATENSGNQEDINKLYGFSDNNAEHQQFSARFGWNWARGALRLYAYVYNSGIRISKELLAIEPDREYSCSIKVSGNKYIYSVDNIKVSVKRASTSKKGLGYKLYPYFGGDEVAPHDVHIWIKEL